MWPTLGSRTAKDQIRLLKEGRGEEEGTEGKGRPAARYFCPETPLARLLVRTGRAVTSR